MLFKHKKCSNCDAYYDPTLEECPNCHKNNELYLNRILTNGIVNLHPLAQIGLFLVGFAMAGMLITEVILAVFFKNLFTDKSAYEAFLISLTYILMLVGLASIVLTTRREHFFSKYKRKLDYIYGVAYAITLVLVGSLVSSFISLFYEVSDNVNQSSAIEFIHNYPILAFFILGFVGPICEELTYRVGLYSFLKRVNKYAALGLTAVIFALIHFDFTAADMVNEVVALPIYIVSGAILTLAYEHRGPACSMTTHMAYNIFSFLMILMF